jgi:hypothetical protein
VTGTPDDEFPIRSGISDQPEKSSNVYGYVHTHAWPFRADSAFSLQVFCILLMFLAAVIFGGIIGELQVMSKLSDPS